MRFEFNLIILMYRKEQSDHNCTKLFVRGLRFVETKRCTSMISYEHTSFTLVNY